MNKDFYNQNIQKSINEISPSLNSYLIGLDKISTDIKNLEKYLQEKGVTKEVRYCFDDLKSIAWSHSKISKKMRLHYYVYERKKQRGDGCIDLKILKTKTPLIETKAEIRIEAIRYLPNLIKRIGQQIKSH